MKSPTVEPAQPAEAPRRASLKAEPAKQEPAAPAAKTSRGSSTRAEKPCLEVEGRRQVVRNGAAAEKAGCSVVLAFGADSKGNAEAEEVKILSLPLPLPLTDAAPDPEVQEAADVIDWRPPSALPSRPGSGYRSWLVFPQPFHAQLAPGDAAVVAPRPPRPPTGDRKSHHVAQLAVDGPISIHEGISTSVVTKPASVAAKQPGVPLRPPSGRVGTTRSSTDVSPFGNAAGGPLVHGSRIGSANASLRSRPPSAPKPSHERQITSARRAHTAALPSPVVVDTVLFPRIITFTALNASAKFRDLPAAAMLELSQLFDRTDANISGFIEEDDFSRLVGMWAEGITPLEIERIGILVDVSVKDGFSIGMEHFFILLCRLLPVLSQTKRVVEAVESQSKDQLHRRRVLAAEDESAKVSMERARSCRTSPTHDGSGGGELSPVVTEQCTEDFLNNSREDAVKAVQNAELRCLRLAWAKRAVILTRGELERLDREQQHSATPTSRPGSGRVISYPARPKQFVKRVDVITNAVSNGTGALREDSDNKVEPADSATVIETMVQFKQSVETALLRAPFEYPEEIFGSVFVVFTEEQLEQFQSLFDVLCEREGLLSVAHLHFLLELFTRCGCDDGEAAAFLKEDCNSMPALSFELFLRYGALLRDRLLAPGRFESLSTDALRVQVVAERTEQMSADRPMRRYERLFLKEYFDKKKRAVEDKHLPIAGRSVVHHPSTMVSTSAGGMLPALRARLGSAASSSSSAAAGLLRQRGGPASNSSPHREEVEWEAPQRTPAPHHTRSIASASHRQNGAITVLTTPSNHLLPEKQVPLPPLPKPKRENVDVSKHRRRQDRAIVDGLRELYQL